MRVKSIEERYDKTTGISFIIEFEDKGINWFKFFKVGADSRKEYRDRLQSLLNSVIKDTIERSS